MAAPDAASNRTAAMKKPFAIGDQRKVAWRFLWIGLISMLLVAAFATPASSRLFSQISFYAKYARSGVAWYLRSGRWRADARTYVTHVEHLFCPRSGAGARIDLELDE